MKTPQTTDFTQHDGGKREAGVAEDSWSEVDV
jgi:hypothetical protein